MHGYRCMKMRSRTVFLGLVLVATLAVVPFAADAQRYQYSSYKSSQPSYVQATYILSTDSYYYPGYGEYPYHAEDTEQTYDEWTGTWY